MSDALAYADRERPRFRAELFDFLRIPSVSAKSEHDGDTRRAASLRSPSRPSRCLTSCSSRSRGERWRSSCIAPCISLAPIPKDRCTSPVRVK